MRGRTVAGIAWQLYASTALCVGGAVLGLVALLRELGYHVARPGWAVAQTGAALCAGVILGLWIPRSVIRRRLASGTVRQPALHGRSTPLESPPPGADRHAVRFAATLTGVLMLALGLLWGLSCWGAALLEAYRGFLTRRFENSADVTRALLWISAGSGLTLIGTLTTTTLTAVHGWHRLVTAPHTRVVELWAVILGSALLGGVIASWVESWFLLALAAPGMLFVAGALSVWRESASPVRCPPNPPRRHVAAEGISLLMAAAAALAAGAALVPALTQGPAARGAVGTTIAVLAAALLGGMLFARLSLTWHAAPQTAPLVLLAAAAALLLPDQRIPGSGNPALVRLVLVGFCAAACVVFTGRRFGRANGSLQYALAWMGVCVAVGMGLPLAVGPALTEWLGVPMLLVLGGLTVVGTAGLALILDARGRSAVRLAGLLAVALWLWLLPRAMVAPSQPGHAFAQATPHAPVSPAVQAGRALLAAPPLRTARVCTVHARAAGGRHSAWQIDLDGPRWDAILIERAAPSSRGPPLEHEARRLIRRCASALARGGRLAIELPADALAEAARRHFGSGDASSRVRAYRLRVARNYDAYEVLLLGRDVPAWIARQPRPAGFEVSLVPAPPRRRAFAGVDVAR